MSRLYIADIVIPGTDQVAKDIEVLFTSHDACVRHEDFEHILARLGARWATSSGGEAYAVELKNGNLLCIEYGAEWGGYGFDLGELFEMEYPYEAVITNLREFE